MKAHTFLAQTLGSVVLTASLAGAAAPIVSNVSAQQRTDGSKKVDINYNVSDADAGDVLHVYIQVSDDNGATFDVNAVTLSGNVGSGITPGSGKHIVWDAGNDIPGEYGENYRVRVTAWDASLDSDPSRQMVYFPAGTFTMGQVGVAEPVHQVTLDAFLLDRTEVTNEEYAKFIDAGGYLKPEYWLDNFVGASRPAGWSTTPPYYSSSPHSNAAREPVTAARWREAFAYCNWKGKRLPSEAEWERAARGLSGRLYPWGNAAPTCTLANFRNNNVYCNQSGQKYVVPVASLPSGATPEGVFDMAGNVAEWTRDWPCYYAASAVSNPVCDTQAEAALTGCFPGTLNCISYRAYRGGSAHHSAEIIRAANREYNDIESASTVAGFRCAQSAD